MSLVTIMLAAAFVASEGGEELRLFQTTEAKDFREIATPGFTIHPYPAVEALDVDAAEAKHEFLALGASLTDASAWVLADMPAEKRKKLLRELFTSEGCNLGAIRLNIGASDYSTALYSYNDTPGDVEMKNFSLARDVRPDLYVFAAPWSPPGWMKTSGLMIGGNLKDEFMPALANYFVKYVQGYAERGIRIDAVTPQNETMCDTHGQYPCCVYTAEQEGVFVKDHLSPAFRKADLDVRIWVHDHNPEASRGAKRLVASLVLHDKAAALDAPYERAVACDDEHIFAVRVPEQNEVRSVARTGDLHDASAALHERPYVPEQPVLRRVRDVVRLGVDDDEASA